MSSLVHQGQRKQSFISLLQRVSFWPAGSSLLRRCLPHCGIVSSLLHLAFQSLIAMEICIYHGAWRKTLSQTTKVNSHHLIAIINMLLVFLLLFPMYFMLHPTYFFFFFGLWHHKSPVTEMSCKISKWKSLGVLMIPRPSFSLSSAVVTMS